MRRIHLLEPQNGATTLPLQLHAWPDGHIPSEELLDRSQPRPVEFAWEALPDPENTVEYVLLIGHEVRLIDPLYRKELYRSRHLVYNLSIGERYYWRVVASQRGKRMAASPVWSFNTHLKPPRWLRVPEITNIRDVGGWPLEGGGRIRQGLLLRSSELNSHLQLTEEGKRILEADFGVRTDIDLRGSEELCEPALSRARVAYHNFPIQPYRNIAETLYQPDYRRIFRLLANPESYPAIIHCWGGADRTGTVVFLLQALLGMGEADLLLDYELTSQSIWGERNHASAEFQEFLKILSQYAPAGVNLHAQSEGYLRAIGVEPDEIANIRQILTEC